MNQIQQAKLFRSLHVKGAPVILYNIWDPGSAQAVADAGAKAIATGSAPVAMAHGFTDGEVIPMDLALANARRIVSAVSQPVTLDFEGAYGPEPEKITENTSLALDTGVVGFNFEDQVVGGEGLHPINAQAKRIAAMREGCGAKEVPAFINARTDLFLKARVSSSPHTREMIDEAVDRATAYAEAGADGFFAPGLLDLDLIGQLCKRVSLPVNIIALPDAPESAKLAEAGVARISYGPVPYRKMVAWLSDQASEVFR